MIPIAEIFGPTIQGEGPDVGLKSIFVRVAGCDFRCSWCDSKFATKVNENTPKYTTEDLSKLLLYKCSSLNCKSIILTGGNPCLYDFRDVITSLQNNNIKIGVETQGSIFPEWLSLVDTIVISPKAPSSKQIDTLDRIKEFVTSTSNKNIAIKIPVFNDEDFEFSIRYYNSFKNQLNDKLKFYLSVGNDDVTASGSISERILSCYEALINKVNSSCMEKVYILPQVHTLVWGNKQGV